MRIYLKKEEHYYCSETGEEVEYVTVSVGSKKGIVVEISENQTITYTERDKENKSSKYRYHAKDNDGNKWIHASSLTTIFLKRVLFSEYNTTAIVIKSDAFVISLFGGGVTTLKNITEIPEAEIELYLESIFQGIQYTEVPLASAISLVIKKPIKQIIIGIFLIFMMIALYLINSFTTEIREKEIRIARYGTNKIIKPLTEVEKDVYRSMKLINALMKHENSRYGFIGRLDFSLNQFTEFSLVPLIGFKKDFYLFKKIYTGINRNNVSRISKGEIKPYDSCLVYFLDDEVIEMTDTMIHLNVEKYMSVGELYTYFKKLQNCPLSITGGVNMKNIATRKVNMSVKLYKEL